MSLARTLGIGLTGLRGEAIDIEVDVSNGLPTYSLLGLPDATLNESRDRIRAAILNSDRAWPNKKVTVSLSPAWLPKSGSSFDLAISLAILAASDQLDPAKLEKAFFLGELSLEGLLRPIRGALPILIAARELGVRQVVVPVDNLNEARLLRDLEVIALPNLKSVLKFLESGEKTAQPPLITDGPETGAQIDNPDMSEVSGHKSTKFALQIAAAGGHHLLMIGAPGCGKTMLAERFPTILPLLDEQESIEVAGIHSIAGTLNNRKILNPLPPFIAPHHSTTIPAMVGGGSGVIRPGACSLAHHGVLFIDEAPECASGVLDSLRQPLESGKITITRSATTTTFPARFMLLLAANPCPCGKYAGRGRGCECTSIQVRRYLAKLSGPLLDRIDLRISVMAPTRVELTEEIPDSSAELREKVTQAREVAASRFNGTNFKLNSEIPPTLLRGRFRPRKDALSKLHKMIDEETLSARGFHRTIRTSWSIADLRGVDIPGIEEVELALSLRSGGAGE